MLRVIWQKLKQSCTAACFAPSKRHVLGELKSDDCIFGYSKGNRTVLQVLGSHVEDSTLHSSIQFIGNRTDNCLFESGCT